MKRKRKLRKWVYVVLLITALSLLLYSGYGLYTWQKDGQKITKMDQNIKKETPVVEQEGNQDKTENINPPQEEEKENDYWDYIKMDLLNVDFNALKTKNPDTVGWIKVNGTNINYPIVQTTNNTYYLDHAYDKSKNQAGWIFADYRNDLSNFSYNTIIYGHGRLDKTMFGSLKNILNGNWQQNKNNHVIKLSTPTENTLWQVFSVYTIEKESYYITTKFTEKTYETFLETIQKRSKINFDTSLNTQDKILTLSTCQDNYGHRVVMHAKLIKKETR